MRTEDAQLRVTLAELSANFRLLQLFFSFLSPAEAIKRKPFTWSPQTNA